MNIRSLIRSFLIAGSLTLGTVAVLAPTAAMSADSKAKPPKASEKVGRPLTAAIEAARGGNFDAAMAKILEAEAVEKKTPYDQFKINDIKGYVLSNQQKFVEAATTYEKLLATPEFFEPAHENLIKKIAVFYFQAKDFPKTIEYGKRWVQDHPEDTDILDLMGQSNYQIKQFQPSRELFTTAIGIAERDGKPPKEVWLRYLQANSVELEDNPGINAAYEKMVRYYPKPETWDRLLTRLSINERNDKVMFQWLRLMADVDALKKPEQFIEYAQLATDAAMPLEAQRVIELGYQRNVLGAEGKEKENQQKLRDRVKASAAADKAQLPQAEKDAAAPNAKPGSVAGLGLAYFSDAQYDKAIPQLQNGLKMGGLKNTEECVLALGISQWRTGQKEQARETFKSIPQDSAMAKVASTWVVRTYN